MQEIFISEEEIALLMKRRAECDSGEYQEKHAKDYGLEPHLRDEGKQQIFEVGVNILKQNFSSYDDIREAVSRCFECRKGSEVADAEPYLSVDSAIFLRIWKDEFVGKISEGKLLDLDLENFCSCISKYLRCVPAGINKWAYILYQPLLDACDKIKLKDGYLLDFARVLMGCTLPYTRKADDEPVPYAIGGVNLSSASFEKGPLEGYYKAFPLNEPLSEECFVTLYEAKIERIFNGYKVASPEDEGNPFRGLEFEKSGSGFFQFALFYNTIQHLECMPSYVFTRQYLDEILEDIVKRDGGSEISTDNLALLRRIDLRPRVTIEGDSGEVFNVVFSSNGGFYYQHSHITWPNLMNRVEIKKIVHYDSGLITCYF